MSGGYSPVIVILLPEILFSGSCAIARILTGLSSTVTRILIVVAGILILVARILI